MPEQHEEVSLNTSLFGLRVTGGNALFTVLLLAVLGNVAVSVWMHYQRAEEHQKMLCATKLAIFIYTQPKGNAIDWERLPVDLYGCVPKFLYERPTVNR